MPFNPFRTSRPRMTYIPDPLGRVGLGEWRAAAARDPFGRVAADGPDDAFDFSDPFHPAAAVGARGRNAPNDVANLEGLLRLSGDMDLAPTDGPTGYFGARLDDAIRAFQRRKGLAVDGAVHPGGETLRALARHLQAMGRNGDTVLAHLTPEEARYLHAVTDGGTVNPRTGLLEFFDNSKKKGTYIWRTVGDGKVRSSHADRNGKVFSWADPPEGGHPGDAPNCRCWAEEIADPDKCKELEDLIFRAENEVKSLKRDYEDARKHYYSSRQIFVDAEDGLIRVILSLPIPRGIDKDDGFLERVYKILKSAGLLEWFETVSNAWHRRNETKLNMEKAYDTLTDAEAASTRADNTLSALIRERREKCG